MENTYDDWNIKNVTDPFKLFIHNVIHGIKSHIYNVYIL